MTLTDSHVEPDGYDAPGPAELAPDAVAPWHPSQPHHELADDVRWWVGMPVAFGLFGRLALDQVAYREVAAAVVAIGFSQSALRAERRHQRLRERYRDAVDLLTAFEAVRAAIPKPWDGEADAPTSQDRRVAAARYLALLRASEEPLPINRGMQRHIPYGADDAAEAEHLGKARLEGDPESETRDVMAQRGEILDVIEGLRERLTV